MRKYLETFKLTLSGVLTIFVALLLMGCANQVSAAPEKSRLSILYVGSDPNKPLSDRDRRLTAFPERVVELRKSRSLDFEQFLKEHFEKVSVVYGDTFKEGMSASYDVTIIDAYLPAIVEKGGMVVDSETGEQTYVQPKYLTEQYNAAMVMIGEPSAFIGEGRQLKIDHLCLCLDAHAHSMKLNHPIFNVPYKVEINYEERETPGNYKARYTGRHLGDTMPMWRMQIEGYEDGKGFPVGLVSTGYGFDNGIDAEWISSGTCIKGVEAMAIGRHANFLHWGFAGAPRYMTESAKLAFINSIHYIASFKGAKQVTRKIKGVRLKGYNIESQWMVSDQGAAAWLAYIDEARIESVQRKAEIQAKKEAGEPLTDQETRLLELPDQPKETRAWTIQYESDHLKEKFGQNWAAYEKYYAENMDYFYPSADQWHEKDLDEDAKSLGIAVGNLGLLEAAVGMLVKGEQVDMANRILNRYTNESFQSATEWSAWLKANYERLYFSEGDGYKFIVLPEG
ncbi:hypothetical protein QP938_10770 [Porticoccaceae bacterium LTM1]|nr:hypothetical protein QP938_10770 [Porticoccaceae bacterium LTM1]